MKRFLCGTLSVILLLTSLFSMAAAEEAHSETRLSVCYFEDGSYCVTAISDVQILSSDMDGRTTITGTKTKSYYDTNDELAFSAAVKGTFTYNGTTASAVSSQHGYRIYDTAWSFSSGYSYCSGATATAVCTFSLNSNTSRTLSVSLTCSPTGVLS